MSDSDAQPRLTLALIQASLEQEDPAANRARLAAEIEALNGTADLILLPETFATGFLGDERCAAESMAGESVLWMQEIAARHRAAVCGSLVIAEAGGRRNRMLFVAPEGTVGHYDKRHLFAYAGEDRRFGAGDRRVVWHWHGWRICPQICYDLRFPVWCRNQDDYDLLLVVANWPAVRCRAWRCLLQARAIENQAWVAGVNRAGPDGRGIVYGGLSAVYDPAGEPALELDTAPAAALVEIALENVHQTRRSYPFLADRDQLTLQPSNR